MSEKRTRKGTFGDVRLPVAGRYLYPGRRRLVLAVGGVALVVLLLYALLRFLLGYPGFFSDGPLSSNHAKLEGDCAACHVAFGTVADASCSVCHEKYGDELGTYTFAAHYLYRSGDFQRLVPSEHEMPCSACHVEHRGREAEITVAPDARCLDCHDYGSFNREHPQFEFARDNLPDAAGLKFPHIHHVAEVMKQRQIEDVEVACLQCHEPRPDGRSFQPIDFDRHCDACHLTATTVTPRLPIRQAGSTEPGVETLEDLRQSGAPGTQWALFTNPNEFRRAGDGVRKSPVYHRDPWILENLRQLRRQLYPDAGLADLLRASPDVPPQDLKVLYQEALDTLKVYADGLRGESDPAVQEELAQIRDQIAEIERRLEDPYTPLDETKFLLALDGQQSVLDAAQTEAVEALVRDLTQPCQRCHEISRATIERVQKDQRVLRRAEFNHRTHILQLRCLDCHVEIPIAEFLKDPDSVGVTRDQARIQNLPHIETCRGCHNPRLASNRCVTCHLFHPDETRHADLLLYTKDPPPAAPAPEGVP